MLRKRIIGVITVKDDWAVQSFSYNRYLPLGRPEIVAENLSRWKVDEILVQCIDRSKLGYEPNWNMINKVVSKISGTPLSYGGGIKNSMNAIKAIELGVERVIIDSLLIENPQKIENIANEIGAQSLIASIPVANVYGLERYNYLTGKLNKIEQRFIDIINSNFISEILLNDYKNDGGLKSSFDLNILKSTSIFKKPIITFGGINNIDLIVNILKYDNVSAVAIGNMLNYREISVNYIKNRIVEDGGSKFESIIRH